MEVRKFFWGLARVPRAPVYVENLLKRHRRDGSVKKVFLLQVWGSEFGSTGPTYKNPGRCGGLL